MPFILALAEAGAVEAWMQQAFYPVLLGILLLASLGVPIPEDVPLIAAGVLLHTHPGIASWGGTLAVALVGIMAGDVILYRVGHMWGRDLLSHRSIRWLVTAQRFEKAQTLFHRYGLGFCFFGRFFMGIRAAMCLTAGAMHFPFWRFFLADLSGAVLSAPLFVALGYWFAGMVPTLRTYIAGVEWILVLGLALVITGFVYVRYRRRRRRATRLNHVLAERAARWQTPLQASPPAQSEPPTQRATPAPTPVERATPVPAPTKT